MHYGHLSAQLSDPVNIYVDMSEVYDSNLWMNEGTMYQKSVFVANMIHHKLQLYVIEFFGVKSTNNNCPSIKCIPQGEAYA